ncbi:flagellar biosynthesis protein FliH [uncultured Sphingomonas sp.]|uniref:FliH/SctL family protein n=1 Tax=uncultured Sphingomonas sp. TaxID=158754 RepID=UPI0035CC3B13
MSDFHAGFAARHDAAAHILQAVFAPPMGFAPADLRDAAAMPRPRHFSPADAGHNPTAGWNPLDPTGEPSQFIDPISTAHTAGYEEGLAAAAAAARESAARDERLLSTLGDALATGGAVDRDRIARQLRQTVLFLVTRLVGEVGVSADLLGERVELAAELLADSAESALLRLNPADVPLVEGKLPKTVFAAGDMGVGRGSFVLESASTIVEDGPDLWVDQLASAFDRAAVPAAC